MFSYTKHIQLGAAQKALQQCHDVARRQLQRQHAIMPESPTAQVANPNAGRSGAPSQSDTDDLPEDEVRIREGPRDASLERDTNLSAVGDRAGIPAGHSHDGPTQRLDPTGQEND